MLKSLKSIPFYPKLRRFLGGVKGFVKYRIFKQSFRQSFLDWQKKHQNSNFADYYVERELQGMQQKGPHPTLGGNLCKGAFQQQGDKGIFRLMLEDGLQPHHVCVDYGCGSLRVGQHLIQYLETGNYYGLDVTDAFFEMGKKLIDPAILQQKQPTLAIIKPEGLRQVAEKGVDFIFSVGVLSHVPPADLSNYFQALLSLCDATTKLYIAVTSYKKNLQIDELSWAYQKAYIRDYLFKLEPDLKIEFVQFKKKNINRFFKTAKMERGLIRITRK